MKCHNLRGIRISIWMIEFIEKNVFLHQSAPPFLSSNRGENGMKRRSLNSPHCSCLVKPRGGLTGARCCRVPWTLRHGSESDRTVKRERHTEGRRNGWKLNFKVKQKNWWLLEKVILFRLLQRKILQNETFHDILATYYWLIMAKTWAYVILTYWILKDSLLLI